MARWLRKRMKKQEKFNDQLKATAQSANEAIPEVMSFIGNIKGISGGAGAGVGAGSPMTKKYKNPCWKNFKMVGTKKKNGKTVPNCVPKSKRKKKK